MRQSETYEEHGMLPMGLERLVKESLEFTIIDGRVISIFLATSLQSQAESTVLWRTVVGSAPQTTCATLRDSSGHMLYLRWK